MAANNVNPSFLSNAGPVVPGEEAAGSASPVDLAVDGIFAGQAALARAYGRQMREYRCGCVDGCPRCQGDGFVTR